MSTLNEEGVMNVKQVACDRLLSSRVETKLQVSPLCILCRVAVLLSAHPVTGMFLASCRHWPQSRSSDLDKVVWIWVQSE